MQFKLPWQRDAAFHAIDNAEDGWVCEIREPKRSDPQNNLFHDICGYFEKNLPWHGCYLNKIVWKRLIIASYLREIGERVEMIPALDGNGFDVIYEETSRMGVSKMSGAIEWATKFDAENGITRFPWEPPNDNFN